jgi:hypothetical protein
VASGKQRLFGLLLILSAAACRPQAPDAAERYEAWRQGANAQGVTAYGQVLADAGVGDVVPMSSLLRSSRRWRACDMPEFQLPPSDRAAAIVPTLRLVARLQAMGIVDGENVRSGYRSAEANHCAGGSSRSRHVLNNALDFDLADGRRVDALCEFWRAQGQSLDMGLGFYTPTKIHLDTAGYRTWGKDYRRGTSLCLSVAPQSEARTSRTRTP